MNASQCDRQAFKMCNRLNGRRRVHPENRLHVLQTTPVDERLGSFDVTQQGDLLVAPLDLEAIPCSDLETPTHWCPHIELDPVVVDHVSATRLVDAQMTDLAQQTQASQG